MGDIPLIITVTPNRLAELNGLRRPVAHMAYRVHRGAHLYRVGGGLQLKGGLMGIDSRDWSGGGEATQFCQEVYRECSARGFRGVVCDFEGRCDSFLAGIITQLGEGLRQRGWTLYVPESYGTCSPHARVMISSALSGGALKLRLTEAVSRFGAGHVVLAVERLSEDFFLPAITGTGTVLSAEELRLQIRQRNPSIFFSNELCARYFTYMERECGIHFVLYDDCSTIEAKIKMAEELGFVAVVVAWQEVAEFGLIRPLDGEGNRGYNGKK